MSSTTTTNRSSEGVQVPQVVLSPEGTENVIAWLLLEGKDCNDLLDLLRGLIPCIQVVLGPNVVDRLLIGALVTHPQCAAWHYKYLSSSSTSTATSTTRMDRQNDGWLLLGTNTPTGLL
jgi:hypothetical protein